MSRRHSGRRLPPRAPDAVRAFLAIRVPLADAEDAAAPASDPDSAPDSLRRDLLRRLLADFGSMGTAVKPVASNAVHLTLKFFGDVSPAQIASIREITAAIAAASSPFTFQVRGLGAFPSERRPSVIWAGLEDGDACVTLVEELELALGEAGFPLETRAFKPHVTLARIKARPPERLAALLSEHASTDFGTLPVQSIELIASELTPTGPIYKTLGEYPLG